MIRFTTLLVGLLMVAPEASRGAPSVPTVNLGDIGSTPFIATHGDASRTPADVAADDINVKWWGAKGDDVTDDTDAINKALNYARGLSAWRLVFPYSPGYRVTRTLNATDLKHPATLIDGGGATIDCQTKGMACIDAMGSRWLRVRDLTVRGNPKAEPTIGMQIGRIGPTMADSEDNHNFEGDFFTGSFSTTAFYNNNSESTKFDNVFFWNNSSTGYDLIQDGLNHFDEPTLYPGGQTQPVDRAQSFNGDIFINCDFRSYGGHTPIWMANTSQHRYYSSYVANVGGPYAVLLYGTPTAFTRQLFFDVHVEAKGLTDVFLVSGTQPVQTIPDLTYNDVSPLASNSVFKLDTGVRSASLLHAKIEITAPFIRTWRLFDNPSAWPLVTGEFSLPLASEWNVSATSFQGISWIAGIPRISMASQRDR